ncbi:hypothetical protein NC651_027182 [Populus alba x Populus x berolinensis]|nr:hypothetical protein NC651_027182 [Populus alba x Populus x berolinensis]
MLMAGSLGKPTQPIKVLLACNCCLMATWCFMIPRVTLSGKASTLLMVFGRESANYPRGVVSLGFVKTANVLLAHCQVDSWAGASSVSQ